MNDQRIAVLTDSGTNTPLDFAHEHDVRIVPLLINYKDGITYRSGEDISTAEVVARLDEEIPTTSLPTPQMIKSAIEQARDDGYQRGVFVTISSTLSATYQTVKMMARMVDDFELAVCDTKSIGVVAGMVVMRAVDMIEQGIPFGELKTRLDDLADKSQFLRLGHITQPAAAETGTDHIHGGQMDEFDPVGFRQFNEIVDGVVLPAP